MQYRLLMVSLFVLSCGGCVVHDGGNPHETPLWWPSFMVRDGTIENPDYPPPAPNSEIVPAGASSGPVTPNDDSRDGDKGAPDGDKAPRAADSATNSQAAASAPRQPAKMGFAPIQWVFFAPPPPESREGTATLYPARGQTAVSCEAELYPPKGDVANDPYRFAPVYPPGSWDTRGPVGP